MQRRVNETATENLAKTEINAKRRNAISQSIFHEICERFGWCASWAIWSPASNTPKSGIADLKFFDDANIASTIKLLHSDVIFIGLNISRDPGRQNFANFHSDNSKGQDYKLRFALEGTPYWGGYMTDIIKGVEQVSSSKLMADLRNDATIEGRNSNILLDEIQMLGSKNPLLVALGNDAHKILERNFGSRFRIVRVPHYASYVSPQVYRDRVLAEIDRIE